MKRFIILILVAVLFASCLPSSKVGYQGSCKERKGYVGYGTGH